MQIKFYSLLAAVALSAVGCVDNSYDLSEIDNDNIVVGTDESIYTLPIATITVKRGDFDSFIADANNKPSYKGSKASTPSSSTSTELTFTQTLDLANAFLPTGKEVDVDQLTSDDTNISTTYTEQLSNSLVTQLQASPTKREEFAQILVTNQSTLSNSSADDIYTTLGIDLSDASNFDGDGSLKLNKVNEALTTTLADLNKVATLQSTISSTIMTKVIKELKTNKDTKIDRDIEAVDLPQDLIDILTGSGSVHILASYNHDFPFTFNLDELTLVNESMIQSGYSTQEATISFPVGSTSESELSREIDLKSFAKILREGAGAQVLSDLKIKTYTSSAETGNALTIKIVIKKQGGLSL